MSEPRTGKTPTVLLVGLPVLAVALAGAALYVALVRAPMAESSRMHEELLLRLTGLTAPTVNKLDPAFTDADGDLVADTPTDVAKLVDPDVIKFTYIAEDEPEKFQAAFQGFTDHLQKVTGKKVEYVPFSSVDAEIAAFCNGEVHVMGLNTGNIPRVVNVGGFVPIAMPSTGGEALYRSVLIASSKSGIKSLGDVNGKEVLLTDAGSNSGYRVPLVMLKNAGLLPVKNYQIIYSGGHLASIEKLKSGEFGGVAAVASDLLKKAVEQGVIGKGDYVEVAASEAFPVAAIGVTYNLKPELAAKIREATLGYEFSGTVLEKELGAAKFVPVNYKDHYALVRKIDDDTGQVHKRPGAK